MQNGSEFLNLDNKIFKEASTHKGDSKNSRYLTQNK